MAVNWIEGVIQNSQHKGSSLLLLIILAENGDRDTGTCYPGIATLSRLTRLSHRSVQDNLRILEASGEITTSINGSPYGTNLYTLSPSLLTGGANFAGGAPSRTNDGAATRTTGVRRPASKPLVEPSVRTVRNIYPESFDEFWAQYPRGRGSKTNAYAEWKRIPEPERPAILSGLTAWLTCPQWGDLTYVPYAERFIKRRQWENPPHVRIDTPRPDYNPEIHGTW